MVRKHAESVGSAPPDPTRAPATAAPIPQPAVENKPAPGQRGPRGLGPRTTYSRVNTGIPPAPDAGAMAQKSMVPRGLESLPKLAQEKQMTTAARPTLQDFIKTAMESCAEKVDISRENARAIAETSEEKVASATPQQLDLEYATKLADALDFIKTAMDAAPVGPGKGPNAMGVMPATSEGDMPDAGEQGKAHHQPPTNPPQQKDPTRSADPGTGLETNDSMMHGEQPTEPIANEKATLTNENVKASAAYINNLVSLGLVKVAANEQGVVDFYPVNEAVAEMLTKQANNSSWVDPRNLGARYGSTVGGAAGGAAGGGLAGAAAGGLGGAAAGGLGGAALGGLGGLAVGGPAGAVLGAGAGALGGGIIGGGTGAALGSAGGAAYGGITGGMRGHARGAAGAEQLAKQQAPKTASAEKMAQDEEAVPEKSLEERADAVKARHDLGAAIGNIGGLGLGALAGHQLGERFGGQVGAPVGAGLGALLGSGLGSTAGGALGAGSAAAQNVDAPSQMLAAELAAGGGSALGHLAGGAGGAMYGAIPGALGGAATGALLGGAGGAHGRLQRMGRGALAGAGLGAGMGAGMGGLAGGTVGGGIGARKGYLAAMEANKPLNTEEDDVEKAGSILAKRAHALLKEATQVQQPAAASPATNPSGMGEAKTAEDAINPAQISGGQAPAQGATPPPGAVASGEGAPSEPADVNSQKNLISSNEAAINYTKKDAKGDPKSDLKDVLTEPALSAGTDKTLQQTLDHTEQAGAKISSAQKVPQPEINATAKVARARAVLAKLAEGAGCAPSGKKTKKAQGPAASMAATPSSPSQASGFNASTQM